MFDLIYRFDPANGAGHDAPASSAEVLQLLAQGNRNFVEMTSIGGTAQKTRVVPFDPHAFGWGLAAGEVPAQARLLPSSAAPMRASPPRWFSTRAAMSFS